MTPHAAPRLAASSTLVALACLISLTSLGCSPAPIGSQFTQTITAYNHTLTLSPTIDRYTHFGPTSGPNFLNTRDLDAPVITNPHHPDYNEYTFRGGCYTWVAPQNAWRTQTGELQNWPPDPAMDRGPANITNRTTDSITTITPVSRLGLSERKTFTLTPTGGLLTYELINNAATPIEASPWINTAVTTSDRIALYMPPGTTLRGWDAAAVSKIESILSPPTTHGWRILNLHAATWQGGTKVWITTPNGDATIAIWREGRWFIRTMDQDDPDNTLAAVSEGPVAVYIDPTDNLIEAELYAPITTIAPGSSFSVTEYWQVLPHPSLHPTPDDLVRAP